MDPIQAKLKEARVARLATVDAEGRPHMVPVCFAYDGEVFYTQLTTSRSGLRRKSWPE